MWILRILVFVSMSLCVFFGSVSAQPKNAEEFHQSCSAFIQKKIFLSAVRDCTRSLELKPGDAEVLFSRGVAYNGINDSWRSLEDINAVLKIKPQDTEALGERAVTYLRMYEYELALADMTRILQIKPDTPAALFERSLLYEKLNKRDLAKADIQKLLQLLPNDPGVKKQAALLDSLSKPSAFPIRAIEADVLRAPASSPALDKLKQRINSYKTKQLVTETDCIDALGIFDQSYLLFDQSDKKADSFFLPDTRRGDYYQLVGLCLLRFPGSVYLNTEAYNLTIDPDRLHQLHQASLLGQYYADRSMLIMRTLLANSERSSAPAKFRLLNSMELSYMTAENYPRSVEIADQVAKLGPEYLDTSYRMRWRAQRGLKKYDLALADLDRLIALRDAGKTKIWVRHYLRAELLNDANRPAEAIKAAEAALVKEPDEWQATMQKARALRLQKKYDLALAEIQKIFAKYPNAMYIRGERAMIYRGMGDLTKAYADEA